eukprot:TRINITY_DN38542_c0_g1_i1.p1 TRINITY_DN38542_c0_g1~~TRINITY_DN38542_c0_g1_i1.p1  ORF type:complete len:203 (-),score=17.58 TRINITY_DN38542_c0_g1_i1:7-615(-)
MAHIWRWYNVCLLKHPLIAKPITAAFIAGCGDITAQSLSYRLPSNAFFCKRFPNLAAPTGEALQRREFVWKPKRTLRLASLAFTFTPAVHNWYIILDRLFGVSFGRPLALKMALDQTVFSSTAITYNFFYNSLVQGKSVNQSFEVWKNKFTRAYRWSCVVWPAAQFVIIGFVPMPLRVLAGNSVSFFWNIIMSTINHTPNPK